MEINEYQEIARSTAIYENSDGKGILYTVLGLNGEAGECAEKLKKQIRDKNGDLSSPDFIDSLKKEAGDCLWYIACLAFELGLTLEEVAKANAEKLKSRKQRGKIQGTGDDR